MNYFACIPKPCNLSICSGMRKHFKLFESRFLTHATASFCWLIFSSCSCLLVTQPRVLSLKCIPNTCPNPEWTGRIGSKEWSSYRSGTSPCQIIIIIIISSVAVVAVGEPIFWPNFSILFAHCLSSSLVLPHPSYSILSCSQAKMALAFLSLFFPLLRLPWSVSQVFLRVLHVRSIWISSLWRPQWRIEPQSIIQDAKFGHSLAQVTLPTWELILEEEYSFTNYIFLKQYNQTPNSLICFGPTMFD